MTIRYLHLIRSLNPDGGGPPEGVSQLAAAAVRLNHKVEIVTLDPPGSAWIRDAPYPIHCVGPGYLKYGFAPGFIPWIRRNVTRFDAVVVNGIWQFHSLGAWYTLRSSPIPYYVFTHGMLDPWFKRRYPLKHVKKMLYWPWAEYRVLRDARAVLFTSEEERLLARRSFGLYRATEIVVNYGSPGISGDPVAQRELFLNQFPQVRGKRALLFLGRIHPKKGCDLLIEAFAPLSRLHPSLHLIMAGPDQTGMQAQLIRLAERRGVSQAITWTGMLHGEMKAGALRAAEVFVLPSHQENFGIAVAEALSCQLPVLISNKVNIWREIAADQVGFVADDTLKGTQQLLREWLALGGAERRAMAHKAANCFRQRFHIDTAAINMLLLFAQHGAVPQSSAA
jgi:glycosyltransferase involved in cell wall biosynthesis